MLQTNPALAIAAILLSRLPPRVRTRVGARETTADKNKKRDALIVLLRKLALHVEANANGDEEAVLSSGFTPVTKVRVKSTLPKPVIDSIDSPSTGQLVVKVKSIPNAKSFEVQHAPVAANGTVCSYIWQGGLTNGRALPITNLTSGTNYSVMVRVGTNGYTDWSDPVGHMCF